MHGIQISVLGFIVPLKPWQNSDMRATNVDALKGVASMCFTWPGKKKEEKKHRKPYQKFSGFRFITLENL